jgi:hypothetical protein
MAGSMSGTFRSAKRLALWGALATAAIALTGFATAPMALAAEGERVLDPELSLTGGCAVEALDPVADPGCPYSPFPDGPSAPFADPRAVATDDHGNIYVSSFGKQLDGSEARIDIFGPDGEFISELKTKGATSLAIDSKGYLYVAARQSGTQLPILRFAPCAPYEPEAGNIVYCAAPVKLAGVNELPLYTGLAINRDNDHLFANFGVGVREFGSAEEGNPIIRTTATGISPGGAGMAVDAARDRMYASAGTNEERIDIFDLNTVEGAPPGEYKKIGAIEDADAPGGDLGFRLSLAVEEGSGHLFMLDGGNCNLYEFDEAGAYVTTIEFGFQCDKWGSEIGVDNGPASPNGALSDKGRYLYVPSHEQGTGHSFAFFESQVGPPEAGFLAAENVTEVEAELQAKIDPNNLATSYRFELKVAGASTWGTVAEDTIAAGNLAVEVTAAATGLQPGTTYSFRVVAENEEGSDEAEGTFATYPHIPAEPTPCSNVLLRGGLAALLPDCRGYELVTPGDPNGHPPIGTRTAAAGAFTNRQVSPAGEKLPFIIEGGSLPGLGGGTGSLLGDPYLATRTPDGWSTAYIGPAATEATALTPGTTSPDQGYNFWLAEGSGSAVAGGITSQLRYPDGHSEPLGQGSIGFDRESGGELISENGGHVIFVSGGNAAPPVRIEPEAAPDGTRAVYDRTGDGVLHVVSVKPGEAPFEDGENATFMGASLDGEGVAFRVGAKLYLRYDNEETLEVGEGVEFAGVAEGGGRVFYVEADDLKALDTEAGVIEFSESGDVTPAQVSPDGSAAYFLSPSVLVPGQKNPEGDEAQPGGQNLYLSREGQLSFVATVTDRDVEGDVKPGFTTADGLGLWVGSSATGDLARVPARTTPDGGVLLFKSRAELTGYEPEGQAQIYRYDAAATELHCLSCNPTGAAAGSDATLQSRTRENNLRLFSSQAWLENLRADGRRAFFESSEPLVARDVDDRQDVYQWEDQGVGSCTRPGGCVALVSSPRSVRNEYLWAVSRSGDDVFFLSSELLTWADADETPSIYDARVGGGFAEPVQRDCEGEGCRPQLSPPPPVPAALTPVLGQGDNVKPKKKSRRCPKGKRKVKRGGKTRCVKQKQRTGAKKKGGRR